MAYDILTEATLPEVLLHKAPDGSYMAAIDVLKQKIPLIQEGYWEPANDDTSHEFMRTVSEPQGAAIRIGEGAPWEKGSDVPVKEPLMMMGSNLKILTTVLEKAPDPIQYRRNEEQRTVRGMTKTFAKYVFGKGGYGNSATDPRSIMGLSNRPEYKALDTADSRGVKNVFSAGGSGSGTLASIWLAKHGPDGLSFLYPKTASMLLREKDMGISMVPDAKGNPLWYAITNWMWQFGIKTGDTGNVKRLCNWAASGVGSFFNNSSNPAAGEELLIDAINAFPGGDTEGVVIYAGQQMYSQFQKRLNSKGNLYFNVRDVWGTPRLAFDEIPIIRLDTIAADESTIS